jgi:hypothetical protein
VRVFGPTGGQISDVRVDGKRVGASTTSLDGRPVTVVLAELSGPDDVVLTWGMSAGPGQTGDGTVAVSPSVVPGSKSSRFRSAC